MFEKEHMYKAKRNKKSFTLLELLIVVVVISVLATLATPQYIKAVERAKGGKARHSLGLISQAEKMYRAKNDIYTDINDGNFNVALGDWVELPELDVDSDWDYTVTGASVTGFSITATRRAGPNQGETIILNQQGVWGGDFAP